MCCERRRWKEKKQKSEKFRVDVFGGEDGHSWISV